MKIGVCIFGVLGLVAVSGGAFAQEATPPARVGFQMAIRTGYSIPQGDAVKSQKLSDTVTGQVPVIVDLGGKVIPQLFIGGYLGLAFGGAAGSLKAACESANQGCVSVDLTLGVEAQYHFIPDGSTNPWIGYGLGLESMAVSAGQGLSSNGSIQDQTLGLGGFNFARISGGVDFRINRGFGVGPFVEYSIAKFTTAKLEDREIDLNGQTATHQWLTLGARFVIFP